MVTLLRVLCCILLCIGASMAAADMPPSLQQRVDAFARSAPNRSEQPQLRYIADLSERYAATFGADMRELPDDPAALAQLFRAAFTVQFYTHARAHAADMERVYAALAARDAATPEQRDQLHDALVHARDIDAARRYALSDDSSPVLHDPLDAAQVERTLWRVDPTDASATRERLATLPRIIVVGAAACGFTRAAADAIAVDPELGPLFARDTLWLAPPQELAHLSSTHAYNTEHPTSPFVIAHTYAAWPMLDSWDLPTFHFLRDGVVVERVSGWPRDGSHRDAVLAAARRAGLLPTD